MRCLYLLRHAKSSWDDVSLADPDRPLAKRGREAAPRMAEWMKAEAVAPDLVLLSDARRVTETWDLVRSYLGSPPARTDNALYMAPPETMLAMLRGLDDAVENVMVIGHNPGLEQLALMLAGDEKKKALKRLREKFPTAALAVLRFDVDGWSDIARGGARLERFVRPKDL